MEAHDPLYRQIRQQAKRGWATWLSRLTPRTQQVASLLGEKEEAQTAQPQWFLLLIPDVDSPTVQSFVTVETLIEALKDHVERAGCRIYIFYGWEAFFTKKPFRHLVHPDGSTYPLFDIPAELDVQDDHFAGPDPEAELTSTLADVDETEGNSGDEDWTAEDSEAADTGDDDDEGSALEDDDAEEETDEDPGEDIDVS
jgi:hypothetical protein